MCAGLVAEHGLRQNGYGLMLLLFPACCVCVCMCVWCVPLVCVYVYVWVFKFDPTSVLACGSLSIDGIVLVCVGLGWFGLACYGL